MSTFYREWYLETKIQALDFLIATGVSLLLGLFNGRAKKKEKEKKKEEEEGRREGNMSSYWSLKFTILSNITGFFLALSHSIIVYPFFHSENPGSH